MSSRLESLRATTIYVFALGERNPHPKTLIVSSITYKSMGRVLAWCRRNLPIYLGSHRGLCDLSGHLISTVGDLVHKAIYVAVPEARCFDFTNAWHRIFLNGKQISQKLYVRQRTERKGTKAQEDTAHLLTFPQETRASTVLVHCSFKQQDAVPVPLPGGGRRNARAILGAINVKAVDAVICDESGAPLTSHQLANPPPRVLVKQKRRHRIPVLFPGTGHIDLPIRADFCCQRSIELLRANPAVPSFAMIWVLPHREPFRDSRQLIEASGLILSLTAEPPDLQAAQLRLEQLTRDQSKNPKRSTTLHLYRLGLQHHPGVKLELAWGRTVEDLLRVASRALPNPTGAPVFVRTEDGSPVHSLLDIEDGTVLVVASVNDHWLPANLPVGIRLRQALREPS